MLQQITTLFIDGAGGFGEDAVGLFDDVLSRLIEEIEIKARIELANRLAPIGNAPVKVVRRLATDHEISVAGPVLRQSPRLNDADLIGIAQTRSQAHLLAISSRAGIAEPVTDVLAKRGDREVARNLARNRTAQLSDVSFAALVGQAHSDIILAEGVGLRPDIPPRLFRELLLKATDVVQQRLLATADAATQAEIRRVLAKVSNEMGNKSRPRDYTTARRLVTELRLKGRLNEPQVAEFAKNGRYEETVASLELLCGVPIDVVDRLMGGDRPDPILILCKAAGWGWPTARAVILSRPHVKCSSTALDNAFSNFERLSPHTAQRVMRFWQARTTATPQIR
ncbi:DUF2336 domain-containing protein [Rhizobium sp.]|uniref:DUF2336 domain-containing protein n=1 Tax=Rhizobium sp. TaxID=391 RepID=UPI003899916B